MGFLSFWSNAPTWLRLIIPLGFLTASTLLYFNGTIWPYGWAVGTVLLFFCGKSRSEKKGYRF